MKKVFFLLSFLFAAVCAVSAKSVSAVKKTNVVVVSQKIEINLTVCSSGTVQTSSGSVTCIACGSSTSGPNGTDARVADCLMDAMVHQY